MRDLNQSIIQFDYEQKFTEDDFYISKSNEHIFLFLNRWPKWNNKFLNIVGEKFSGKTHLINIFIKKYKAFKINSRYLRNEDFLKIKTFENIVLEDLDKNVNEELLYSLLNNIDQDNKYIIITSDIPITNIEFSLADLRSRTKNFFLQTIKKPDDSLIYALILKNLSDRQVSINKKLIDFIIKRIDRSYSKIFEFIYKVDELSLKKKKPIDIKIIKEVLGE
tara:strand:- start:409 stop:1071 length:663 start_codon:yes stop_codon:yes gene_type:complete